MKHPYKTYLTSILISLLLPLPAQSDEVKMYTDRVPSADEMADILLNKPNATDSGAVKTRSIAFTHKKQQDTTTRIGLPINFDFNSSTLNERSLSYVKQIGVMMNMEKMQHEKIMIIGHTDASGSETYNSSLSQMRAKAVKDYLVKNYQIAAERIDTTGKGEQEPLKGRNPLDPMNRRVEIFRIQ